MRLKVLRIGYFLVLAAIIFRLFYWQILRSDELTAMAEQQHVSTKTIDASRGMILSSDEAILASNKPTYLLYGLPQVVKDKKEVARELSEILIKPDQEGRINPKEAADLKADLERKLNKDLYWVSLIKNIDVRTKTKIEELDREGLGFENQRERLYPESSSAAHLLGFVGADPLGRETGYFGVEGFYDRELRGTEGNMTEEKDARGIPVLMGKFFKKEPQKGHDLILNIDRTVQHIVEKKLAEGMTRFGAKSGSVVVMEPKSGNILGMASLPSYDPNNFSEFPKENYKNPIVGDSYEPGSIFKVLVMAAGINEGAVRPDTKCDSCAGPVNLAGFTIRTWNNRYYKDTTMTDVIVHSDNTGMVFVARKLGLDKMHDYLQKFGMGSPTQIDLQDETSPEIRAKKDWKEIDLATSSFGQGIAVTGIQIARAVAAIANGGNLMEPHVVKAVRQGERMNVISPKIVGKPITPETAEKVTEMMVQAVETGEAKYLALKGFKVAGKTGTAQIPVAGHYDSAKTIASFVGFAPAGDPKFVMLVRYTEPSSSIFGAETAAPTFFEVAKELLFYYGVSPNEL